MLYSADYQLLDFGAGRKLERLGPFVLDRPLPGAEGVRKSSERQWSQATARYDRSSGERGEWTPKDALPAQWSATCGDLQFELKPTEFGHVGLFPEQFANWQWVAEQVRTAERPLKVLNLFAYTGGSTLAASAAGAAVTHVDAAKNVIAWARRNAELNHLSDRPIRWICEDAVRFVQRELKRGNHYDAVILDPPSFGHGPAGEVWRFDALPELLADCVQLFSAEPRFLLLSAHTTGVEAADLVGLLRNACGTIRTGAIDADEMHLVAASGPSLACGASARWIAMN